MNVSRAQIEVAVVVMVVVMAIVVVMPVVIGMRIVPMVMVIVPMIVAQKPCAREIDAEAKHGDGDCLVIPDGDRVHEALHALIADEKRDHAEHNGAGKACKVAELARPEGETVIVKMTPRVIVGQRRYRERGGVRGHVPAIRHECQRAEHRAADDLAHHHHGSQAYNRPDALRVLLVTCAEKYVLVLE